MVVVLAAYRPGPAVAPSAPVDHSAVCVMVDAILAATMEGLAPPIGATPEELAATAAVNALLVQRRAEIMSLDSVKELHCG